MTVAVQPDIFTELEIAAIPEPAFRFPCRSMLSMNDMAIDRIYQAGKIKKWREKGRFRSVQVLRETPGTQIVPFRDVIQYTYRGQSRTRVEEYERLSDYFIIEPVVIVVRLWKSNHITYDIHNLYLKPILDSFVDVKILMDDSVKQVTQVHHIYHGIDKTCQMSDEQKARRTEKRAKRAAKGKSANLPPPGDKRIWIDIWRESEFYPRITEILKK